MAESTTKITAVFRNGPYQGKHGEFTRFDVKGADGRKYQTLKDGLGVKAEGLKGQTVKITYHEKQSGEYTNYEIENLEAVGGESATTAKASQDEFRRSKEEMRRTEAFHIAAAMGVETVEELAALGDVIAAELAQTGKVPEEEPARL